MFKKNHILKNLNKKKFKYKFFDYFFVKKKLSVNHYKKMN